jgi:hypothetical protein
MGKGWGVVASCCCTRPLILCLRCSALYAFDHLHCRLAELIHSH